MMTRVKESTPPNYLRKRYVLFVLVWATMIGDETVGPYQKRAIQSVQVAPKPVEKVADPSLSGAAFQRKKLVKNFTNELDPSKFQRAFLRQAQSELLPCLKAEFRLSGSLALSARLDKNGHLKAISDFEHTSLPPCAVTAMTAMNFSHLTKQWKHPSLVIQWRFDW